MSIVSFINFINRQTPPAPDGKVIHWPVNVTASFEDPGPPLDFIIPGMLSGSVGSLVAPGGAGKSMLALQLAIWLTSGADILGFGADEDCKSVAYLSAEDPKPVLRQRLYAIGEALSDRQKEQVEEHLLLMHLDRVKPDLLSAAWLKELQALAEDHDLLVLDTLRRFHSCDENSGSEMAALLSKLEIVSAQTGCAVLFLHHTSKSATWNQLGDIQQSSRGSSVLTDNVRWQGYLVGMTPNEAKHYGVPAAAVRQYVRFGVSKSNYHRADHQHWFVRGETGLLRPVELRAANRGRRQQRAEI